MNIEDFNKILHKNPAIYYFYGKTVHPFINSYINPKDDNFENIPFIKRMAYVLQRIEFEKHVEKKTK
jgi:hypothetical protein